MAIPRLGGRSLVQHLGFPGLGHRPPFEFAEIAGQQPEPVRGVTEEVAVEQDSGKLPGNVGTNADGGEQLIGKGDERRSGVT